MSIALAANIGGTATLIGSGPNVVLAGITERSHPTSVLLTLAADRSLQFRFFFKSKMADSHHFENR